MLVLPQILKSPMKELLLSDRNVKTETTILQTQIGNGIMLSAVEDLTVVDTVTGARLELENGDTVFTLIPIKCAIKRVTMPGDVVSSLHVLENSTTASEVRGKKRIPVAEDDTKYVTVGLKPNRGSTGITESWPRKLSEVNRGNIIKLMATCHVAIIE